MSDALRDLLLRKCGFHLHEMVGEGDFDPRFGVLARSSDLTVARVEKALERVPGGATAEVDELNRKIGELKAKEDALQQLTEHCHGSSTGLSDPRGLVQVGVTT